MGNLMKKIKKNFLSKALVVIGILLFVEFFLESYNTVQQQIAHYIFLVACAIFLCSGFICIKLDKIINIKKENFEE